MKEKDKTKALLRDKKIIEVDSAIRINVAAINIEHEYNYLDQNNMCQIPSFERSKIIMKFYVAENNINIINELLGNEIVLGIIKHDK